MTTPTPPSATPAPEDLLAKNDPEFVAGFDKRYARTWGEGIGYKALLELGLI